MKKETFIPLTPVANVKNTLTVVTYSHVAFHSLAIIYNRKLGLYHKTF